MKKILLLIFVLPILGFGQQQTYVPDDAFEQALINMGYDNTLDDYVLTANINTIGSLSISNKYISNLIGIEDFNSLTYLDCSYNEIWFLYLNNNTLLSHLKCFHNDIETLNVSNNFQLQTLECNNNSIKVLDLKNNYNLKQLFAYENELQSVNVKNGNNNLINIFMTSANYNLDCIMVDNVSHFNQNFSDTTPIWVNWYADIDSGTIYSEDCNYTTNVSEIPSNKILSKITNVLGQETLPKSNIPLFYLYDDGTVEKRIVME